MLLELVSEQILNGTSAQLGFTVPFTLVLGCGFPDAFFHSRESGNQEMSFLGFPGAREWRLLQYY